MRNTETPMRRYWINQPSTLQPMHSMNGLRVIAPKHLDDDYVTVYFIDGPVISALIGSSALSPGWPN